MRPLRPIFKAFTHPFRAVHQVVLASGTIAAVLLGSAAGSVRSIAKEIIGGTTITVGESNTDAQREELLEFFGASTDAQVIEVTVSETNNAMVDCTPKTGPSRRSTSSQGTAVRRPPREEQKRWDADGSIAGSSS